MTHEEFMQELHKHPPEPSDKPEPVLPIRPFEERVEEFYRRLEEQMFEALLKAEKIPYNAKPFFGRFLGTR